MIEIPIEYVRPGDILGRNQSFKKFDGGMSFTVDLMEGYRLSNRVLDKLKNEYKVQYLDIDDPADQKLIKMSLSREKITNEPYIANSGEEALQYLQRSKNGDNETPMPDLILLDLNMPGMDGKVFLKHIKTDDRLSTIPVVILTTSDYDKDIIESYKLQAAGYINKPGELEEFQTVMQNLTKYWFVICKRVTHDREYKQKDNRCFISG